MYREKTQSVPHIPKMGYAMFKKQFEEPTTDEGFVEVKKISFVPVFESKEDEQLFRQFT